MGSGMVCWGTVRADGLSGGLAGRVRGRGVCWARAVVVARSRSVLRTVELALEAHLSDGEAVAKMGHPDFEGTDLC
jgi:hypothetical protein